ncbi:hypothetical protein CHS0354_018166 [Potamilus streckersoni]|uniref:gamma-glutamylcyclotransferase n=1 Tax=Potamilus streckersoni TaxID=2493646 RepID=A0AAE0W225_9BIVA|nr:hypothetical protein CHS0354_018166 [Potamilus streckersoni]
MARPGKFLYFAYGSNLLKERLKMLNPSAEFVTAAKLEDYELEFRSYGSDPMECRWKGAPASINQKRGSCVWGCVWELRNEHKETLDWQEGVHANVYNPLEVDVFSQDGQTLHCRTYMLSRSSDVFDARPSPQYLDIIIRGAQQNGLPADYIEKLKSIEHNSFQGTVDIYHQILQRLGS